MFIGKYMYARFALFNSICHTAVVVNIYNNFEMLILTRTLLFTSYAMVVSQYHS